MLVAILSGDTFAFFRLRFWLLSLVRFGRVVVLVFWRSVFAWLLLLRLLAALSSVSRDAGCSSSYHHRAAGGSEPLQPWHSAGLGKLCWRTGMHVLYMFFPSSSFFNPLTGWEDQLLVSPLVSIDIMAGWLFLLVPLSLWSHVECSSFVHTWRYALFLHSPPSSWPLQVATQTYSLDANLCLLRLYQVLSFYANLFRHKMTV
jgi:hypothetical protein